MFLQQQLNHHLEAQHMNLMDKTEQGMYDQMMTQVSMMENK